jgi:hypothetical protein
VKSYVKIYGPPTLKALKELEKIAIKTPQVCIMDTIISQDLPRFDTQEGKPGMEHINDLVEKIDEALAPLGCKYTITTK